MCPYLALLADKFCGIMALLAVTRLFLVSSWPRQRRVGFLVILVQPLAAAALGGTDSVLSENRMALAAPASIS